MPRGYPDFFGQSIFLRYGGAQESGGGIVAIAGAETDIIEITGKGVLYNAEMHTSGVNVAILSSIRCYVNSVLVSGPSWSDLRFYARSLVSLGEWGIRCYDDQTLRMHAFFSGPITFDTGVKLTYNHTGAVNHTVYGYLTYALYA